MTIERHRKSVPRRTLMLRLGAGAISMTLLLLPVPVAGQDSVNDTKHNLTAGGPGPIRVGGRGEACVYCHTPHASNPVAPLWNREDPGEVYQTYDSPTLQAEVGQPSGSSRLCLSCHDGTIALGQTYNPNNSASTTVYLQPGDRGYVGTDLRDDHPISFRYDSALAAQHDELRDPAALPSQLPLDHEHQLQCTTCHNPHDDSNGQFLRMSNHESQMCVACHQMTDWSTNPHATSMATLSASTRETWDNIESMTTVSAAGCQSCHRSHSGGGRPWLLRRDVEEDNCYACHDGTVAETDILAAMQRFSAHPVGATTGVHVPGEDPASMTAHVECSDCHTPHRIQSAAPTQPPTIQPTMQGSAGVSSSGAYLEQADYEYEVCYKCHAGLDPVGEATVNRVIPAANIADNFSPNNDSFHPVETQGKNGDVPSLLQPWTTTSMIYCTDCHTTNGDGAPDGPHGSDFEPLLARNYAVLDDTTESSQAYDLCYGCHDRQSILADQSFSEHRRHIVDERTSCATCHDAHGVSSSHETGPATHLINFDRDVVDATATGQGPTFTDLGARNGSCTLSCHGSEHVERSYP
ncbi:MAG: cytochrome c3 family protein [bacterium]